MDVDGGDSLDSDLHARLSSFAGKNSNSATPWNLKTSKRGKLLLHTPPKEGGGHCVTFLRIFRTTNHFCTS